MHIFNKQPWLKNQADEFFHLVYHDCEHEEEKALIYSLIEKIVYIDSNEYKEAIKTMSDYIVEKFDQDTTIIYATATDRRPDSSHEIVYPLKIYLRERGWNKIRVFAQINKLKDIQDGDRIIIVDEFIGTGQTMHNKHREIEAELRQQKYTKCKVSYIAVVGTKVGLNYLVREKGLDVQTFYELTKGITDTYSDYEKYLNIMRNLENRLLAPSADGIVLPSLGYGASESLYKREDGNTPNNVFPIFWWSQYINEKARKTIMVRAV